jgi:hypothetical protein
MAPFLRAGPYLLAVVVAIYLVFFTERQAGEQDMVLLSIRIKQKIRTVGEVLGWIFVLSLVLGPWIAWFIGEPYRHHFVREGELCGPGYRWTYAQPKFADSDLSCEPE